MKPEPPSEPRRYNQPKSAAPQEPAPQTAARWMGQVALVTELPFVLVGTTLGAAIAGYFLDQWLNTRPWLLLIFGAIGFAGGMREMMRRLNSLAAKSPPANSAVPPAGGNENESNPDNSSHAG